MVKRLVLALFSLLIASCVTTSGIPEQRNVTLVYSGNMDGELEPCGCSEGGNKGGIKRRAWMVDNLRAEKPDLFLISTGGLLVSEMPQDKLKSEYILKGLSALDYDAIGVQWRDLAFGESFLKNDNIPFVASNRLDKHFDQQRAIKHGNAVIAYFQWLDPETDPEKQMGGQNGKLASQTDELAAAIKRAKQAGNTTVLATTLKLENAKKLFPLEFIDILLIEAMYEKIGEPQQIGNTLVLQPGSRGMRLGRADLTLNREGKIINWKHEVIPLPQTIPDAERMLAWYQEYNDKVKADYEARVAQRKAMMSGESPYAGEKTCESCHAKEHEIWFDTPHAEAFYKLQDVNKAFDPNCIGCHTVGFEKQGGFIDPALTSNLMHVQCENCHGVAAEHVKSNGKIAVANKGWKPEQMCAQCHVQKHSPDFVFDTYWPRIAH